MSTCYLTSAEFSQQQPCPLQDRNLSIEPLAYGDAHDSSEWALLGESVAVHQLRSQIRRIAPYFRIALIRGEAGTGKELVARAIHALSPGAERAFIATDARLLAESVDRDEPDRSSTLNPTRLLESAQGGTLYLTHVDDLSCAHQAVLLQFLQTIGDRGRLPDSGSGRGARIKGHKVPAANGRSTNPRILLASDRELRSLAAIGQFSQHLYTRASGLEILVPPLLQRADDIPLLAESLLRRLAQESGRSPKLFAESATAWLKQYLWPGNLRELERIVAEAAAFTECDMLEACHLSAFVKPLSPEVSISVPLKIERLHDVVQRHVQDVLTRCGGNKVRAAELLGISRSTLYRMLGAGTASDRFVAE